MPDTKELLEAWRQNTSQEYDVHLRATTSVAANTLIEISVQDSLSVSDWMDAEVEEAKQLPVILVQAVIVVPGGTVNEGTTIKAVAPAWFEILRQLDRDRNFLYNFSKYAREFEELLAGAYKKDGWPDVVLTPRSNDAGRDIIASKPGFASVRFVDQVKAYAPDHRVTADDVRAMLGVLTLDENVSKGIVSTTSEFAPGIERDERIKRFMPYRIELRDGTHIREWLSKLYKDAKEH